MSTRPRRASSRPTEQPTPSKTKSSGAAATGTARKRRRAAEATDANNDNENDVAMEEEAEEQADGEDASAEDADVAAVSSADVDPPASKSSRANEAHTSPAVVTPARTTTTTTTYSSSHVTLSPNFDADVQPSPLLRMKRMEEKNELQELNKRLELYILRQRERDANQGGLNHEIHILKERFKSDMTAEKKHHDQRYEELKKQKLDLSRQLQELQDEFAKVSQQAKDNQATSSLYKQRCAELEKRLKKLEEDATELNKRNIELDSEVKRLTIDYQQEHEAHGLLKSQLESQKSALMLAQKQLNVVQSKANASLQDLEALQASSSEEQQLLNRQLLVLRQENQSIEEQLRREFGAQLQNHLAERQALAEEEKEKASQRLKSYYESSIAEKNEQVRSQSLEIEQLQRSLLAAQRELAAEHKNNQSAASIRADFERQIAKLHELAEQARVKFEEQLQSKTEQVTRSTVIIATKEREFQQLMDVKIALDMEIAQYNTLLGHEESRLGFDSAALVGSSTPTKSRASGGAASASKSHRKSASLFTSSTTTTTSSSSRRQSTTASEVLGLSVSVNSASRKITLTNSNRIDEEAPDAGAITLRGCTLVAAKSKQALELDARKLAPGASLVVLTAGGRAASGTAVQRWDDADEESLWKDGETLQIKDDKGQVRNTVNVRV